MVFTSLLPPPSVDPAVKIGERPQSGVLCLHQLWGHSQLGGEDLEGLRPPRPLAPSSLSFPLPTLGRPLPWRVRPVPSTGVSCAVQFDSFSAPRQHLRGCLPGAPSQTLWETCIRSVLKNVFCYLDPQISYRSSLSLLWILLVLERDRKTDSRGCSCPNSSLSVF